MAKKSIPAATRAASNSLYSDVERAAAAAVHVSEIAGHKVGPLETHTSPADRLATRLAQASAMISLAVSEENLSRMNETIQIEYLAAIGDLVSAAIVDAHIVIGGEA